MAWRRSCVQLPWQRKRKTGSNLDLRWHCPELLAVCERGKAHSACAVTAEAEPSGDGTRGGASNAKAPQSQASRHSGPHEGTVCRSHIHTLLPSVSHQGDAESRTAGLSLFNAGHPGPRLGPTFIGTQYVLGE